MLKEKKRESSAYSVIFSHAWQKSKTLTVIISFIYEGKEGGNKIPREKGEMCVPGPGDERGGFISLALKGKDNRKRSDQGGKSSLVTIF